MFATYRNTLLAVLVLGALAGCETEPTPQAPYQEEAAVDTIPSTINLTVTEGNVSVPTTAIDPQTGTVYWAWFGEQEETMHVYLAWLDPGSTTPSTPVQVNQGPDIVNRHAQAPAQIVVGPEGNVYVAWTTRIDIEGERFPASNLMLARSTDGGRTFEPEIAVNDDVDGMLAGHTFHNIAVGPEGHIYVAWLDGRKRAQAKAQQANGNAHTPIRRANFSLVRHEPGTEVRLARSADGGKSFGENVVVAKNSCQCCRTALAVAADGTVYLAWRHIFGDNIRDMALARSTDGGQTFSTPTRIHEDGWHIDGCPHSGPSLAVDTQGRVHAAWYTGAEQGMGLFYAVSEDGSAPFSTPEPLIRDVPISQSALTADDKGRVWLAWENAPTDQVQIAQVGVGGVEKNDATAFAGETPTMASAKGSHVVTWMEGQAIKAQVQRN
ncbi:MAG TPA: sialidase family protein [Rhodothermales bacterium]|nr:sialidase family protein [Rhodothermales bacterium]